MTNTTADRFNSIIEWCDSANYKVRDLAAADRAVRYSQIIMMIRNVAISGLQELNNEHN